MGPLLSSLLKVMPAIQAKQINEILDSLKVAGQIRNSQEYKEKLEDLSSLVNDNVPKPSFNKISALAWYLCSSDAHNMMMQSAKQDIEASFLQVKELEEKYNDHYVLLIDNLLRDLENGLNKQEAEIKRLSWIEDNSNEFTNALIDTFNMGLSGQFPRNETKSETLYFDNRTYINKSEKELPSAIVSSHGEKLILKNKEGSILNPISVKLDSDSFSSSTEREVQYDDQLFNIIDGKKNTFWTKTVLLDNRVEKVNTVLHFYFGTGKELTYIVIECGGSLPLYVDSIVGISPFGFKINLLTEEYLVDGKAKIEFEKNHLSSVVVTFSNKSFKKEEYFTNKKNNSLTSLKEENMNLYSTLERNDSLSNVVKRAVVSDEIKKICNVPSFNDTQINKYSYSTSIDNVYFGNSINDNSGIYVSLPIKTENVGVVGVSLNKKTETDIVQNSIECEIIKIDTFPKYKETKFPIPELDQKEVKSERLILYKKVDTNILNDTGILRFFPKIPSDFAVGDNSPISVYENGRELLIQNGEWEFTPFNSFSDPSYSLDWKTSFMNFSSSSYSQFVSPIKVFIKIKNPKRDCIYTVDYTIKESFLNGGQSDSETIWLDKERTVYLGGDGRVNLKKEKDMMVSSEIYLQLTLRRNTSISNLSPELYDYTLLTASF